MNDVIQLTWLLPVLVLLGVVASGCCSPSFRQPIVRKPPAAHPQLRGPSRDPIDPKDGVQHRPEYRNQPNDSDPPSVRCTGRALLRIKLPFKDPMEDAVKVAIKARSRREPFGASG
jgi:hypothetical protein